MKYRSHTSAKPSHYNAEAANYDAFNEENSKIINQTIENILKQHHVKTVLDLTCGTGSQVFWLTKRGYQVTGADINTNMLKIAQNKAKQENFNVPFIKGDMRSLKIGSEFDAVITIFNAIGHLTKDDFRVALQNIHINLKPNGFYVFDIFNLRYFLTDNNITNLTIDWFKVDKEKKIREIQYSTIDEDGILASFTTAIEQYGSSQPKMSKSSQTLQIYTAKQLQELLHQCGFKTLSQCNVDGLPFVEDKSERILTVAQKI
ncbi:S-adenosyl-L-methionine-dependent methyltransferases [Legionella busanensis]|uniref:S-adenosyl-L-methionine-dependent methyltransferases n=1 Tax=Legionella busanensis TaxID=190655 RepID=A0A378JK99_9GAMM|nr:class I SAM-dependent methyltransferase [Legionella busanensis]STX51756.1 S-adenosyl-L-methionine-dependent methyltransferases [Legionella busanensis]